MFVRDSGKTADEVREELKKSGTPNAEIEVDCAFLLQTDLELIDLNGV